MNDEERRGMLAWYVNGSLSEAERSELERSFAPDPADLERELAQLGALRAAVAEVGEEEPPFHATLIHDAWRQIRAHEREQAARVEARPAARIARWLDANLASLWRGATGVGRFALAAQLGLVLALGATTWLRAPADPEYGSLSGPAETVPGNGSPPGAAPVPSDRLPLRVKVMFTTDATQQAIGALLLRLDAEIVGGPSNLGLYTVQASAPDPAARASALDALIRSLESEPTLVRGVVRGNP